MTKADDYRGRPSGEILQEQKELARLKRLATIEGRAFWEWDADAHKFNVSQEWQDLTGYMAQAIFPQNLPKTLPIESLLDELVNKWISLVILEDAAECKKHASDFILLGAGVSRKFQHGYRLRRADGKVITVLSTARSVWEDGKLTGLFCETHDISKYLKPVSAASEIVKHETAIAEQETRLEEMEPKVNAAAATAVFLKKWWPAIPVVLISFNSTLEAVIKEGRRTLEILGNPISTVTPSSSTELPAAITPEKLVAIKKAIANQARHGEITLYMYSPGLYPISFTPIFRATNPTDMRGALEEGGVQISEDPAYGERTSNHIAGLRYASVDDEGRYSVSQSIVLSSARGLVQTIFFEIVAADSSEATQVAVDKAAGELATRIREILNTPQ